MNVIENRNSTQTVIEEQRQLMFSCFIPELSSSSDPDPECEDRESLLSLSGVSWSMSSSSESIFPLILGIIPLQLVT